MANLDEIWGSSSSVNNNSSLDNIWGTSSQTQQNSQIDQIWGTEPQQQPQEEQSGITDVLSGAWNLVKEPASTALEALSYLDKPRGAVAGAVKAFEDNTPLLAGAEKGWKENTSWKETFDPEWVKNNPTKAAIAGFATDVALDPLWFVTPAKVVGGLAKGSKAIGLTDNLINPAINALKNTETGKRAVAFTEDVFGKNRVADEAFDFNASRSSDQLGADDLMDAVRQGKSQYGEDFNKLTDYIEASPKGELGKNYKEVMDSVLLHNKEGTLLNKITDGTVTKDQAFNALRDAGEEIPNYLLQNSQRVAKEAGEAIPNAITRDDVLNAIPDAGLRKAIETIGEQFISKNKANADRLRATGRLSDEQYVSYLDGEHLRRSFSQYETPEAFKEAVRKNGTDEEWRRVYQALSNSNAPGSQGFSATHKVDMKDFISRQTLSDETMKKLGLIKDPEYRIMDTLNRTSKTLREDEYLSRIAAVWGKAKDEASDLSRTLPKRREYVEIPKHEAYGELAGKWIPQDVANQVIKMTGTGKSPSELAEGWQKAVSWFKVAKLANPASTMRNFYSGIPMANVFGGLPMQDMPKYMAKATQAMHGGNKSELMREVKSTGILGNVWQKQELRNIIGENPTGVKKLAEWGMDKFGKPDEFWRVATYAYHRDQGKSIKEAAQIANKALFDYSNAPDWINTLSKTGAIPFAKFPYFATKATLKAAYENPAQLSKFTKAQNQVNNEDREKIMPDYLKSKTLLPLGEGTRTVNGKEQKVQNNLDLSYILPFSNDVKLGNPVIDAIVMARTGQNGLGQQVIKPGMTALEKAKEWANWGYNTVMPSIPLPGNYAGDKLYNAYKGNVDNKGRQYDMTTAIGQTLFGLKNVPLNTQELFNQKVTALQNEQRSIKAVMNTIAKDQSLSKAQKIEKLQDHQSQLKQLGKQLQEAGKAWQREKKRGS